MNMNKLLLLATIFLLGLISKLNAQSLFPVHIGIKGGSNYSELPVSNGFNSKYAIGYFVGAMGRFDFKRFYIQNELLYTEKSSEIEKTAVAGSKNAKWRSLEMPLLIGYKVIDLSALNVRIFGGGVYSYVLDENFSSVDQLKNSYTKFNKSNIGYQIGAGVEMWKFTVDVIYQGGLNNVSKDFSSKPNSFNVSVGYFFL
ncbi:PorT family protein [Flavobacterium psychroterrae]|uniref:PorT family protein n=1 Tax=Flavobacterium psychroterrae TaxID=2133767 RepID=A0ABS5PG87_9FLAO|nr:porin family protein [Flavobacterium psychroterrae]MBS7233313.1 PorT family protein [Flavobacterium psychroterrae]